MRKALLKSYLNIFNDTVEPSICPVLSIDVPHVFY